MGAVPRQLVAGCPPATGGALPPMSAACIADLKPGIFDCQALTTAFCCASQLICAPGAACKDSCVCPTETHKCNAGLCKVSVGNLAGCARAVACSTRAHNNWCCVSKSPATHRRCLQPLCPATGACTASCACPDSKSICDLGNCRVRC